MEAKARESYELLTGYTVLQAGLVVRKDQPWLCGSPDGFVDASEGLILIEIKCPFSCAGKDINVEYLSNGSLSKKHEYYCQVQVMMYICDLSTCHFFVWSDKDMKLIIVERDDDYL